MANVIEICGSGNKVIHLNVVTSTTKQEVVTYGARSPGNSNNSILSPKNLSSRLAANRSQSSTTRSITNKDIFSSDDNGEVKTVYFNSDPNVSREQLLLPTDAFIKQELIEYDDFEEYESIDEEDVNESNSTKAQFKCSGCSKAFCFEGWLDRHKQSNPACSDAHPIRTFDEQKEPQSGTSRDRQSLEGRLSELLHCPHDKCDFTTHWVQSLNKHVFQSCKFRSSMSAKKTVAVSSPKSPPKKPSFQVCNLCNRAFSSCEQHIQHMKDVHQIKTFYQCSACKQNFPTKQESVAHMDQYHSGGKDSADTSLSNGSQQCFTCDLCNKSYLSVRSYEIHRTSCEKGVDQPIRKQRSAVVSSPPKKILPMSSSVTHFRREQIEAIHKNDFKCKMCRKIFENSFGLCNHLSRRPVCREWYYTNLVNELKKKNLIHLMPKFSNNIVHNSNSNRHISHNASSSSASKPRLGLSVANRRSDMDTTNQSTSKCKRCNKIFIGKNPTVALTNHLRGSNCVATKCKKPEYVHSRIVKAAQNGPSRVQSYGENRYYCKLCPEVELKNRVSLGCHLTIYHGLPQVNVDTGSGDGFRCQTCSQVFESKYFYNLHRQDCDLTSPYVGMITDDEVVQRKNQRLKGETCDQCGRTGFSTTTAVSIHQKYQCVKRAINKNQSNLRQRLQNSQLVVSRQPKPVVREPVPRQKSIPQAEMARLNDRAKTDPSVTMCDSCGRGPYNSYYYFMEHKKKYCNALKGENIAQEAKAKKSVKTRSLVVPKKPMETLCLFPTVPRARKTFTYANVSPPRLSSQDSSSSAEEEERPPEDSLIDLTAEVTKCSVCPEEFNDTLAFIRHRLGHITEELIISEEVQPIDCELCGARIHHYQRIQQHLILHLQNVQIMKKKNLIEVTRKCLDSRPVVNQSDDEDGSAVLRCPYCNAEYLSRDELAEHIKNTCPYRYQCPFCNNTYSAKESYLQHKEICSKASAVDKLASKTPTFKCRNCGLEFKVKQQLLCHEHACNKVYTADYSGRVEELIERTLTCSVCGLVSDVYESKAKHEAKCLKRYLAVIGNGTDEVESSDEVVAQPVVPMDFNLTSLSNTSESSDVPEEVINNLKEEFGIKKDLKVLLTGFDEDIVRKVKSRLYCESDESTQFEALKESFKTLVSRLTKNDAILFEMSQESSAEVLLQRMLKYLGEEPIQHNGLNQLNCFRQNLQLFLKLTIKDDTLVMAYKDAESVDEAIVNMLNFECEFNS